MYQGIYSLPDVLCVSSNNPVDWMVVYYHLVMTNTPSDGGSYIVGSRRDIEYRTQRDTPTLQMDIDPFDDFDE